MMMIMGSNGLDTKGGMIIPSSSQLHMGTFHPYDEFTYGPCPRKLASKTPVHAPYFGT